MSIGEKISNRRKQKGWSQEKLAELSGISLRTIQRIEKNSSKPRPFTLKTIASTLELNLETLQEVAFVKDTQEQSFRILRLMNFTIFILLPFPFLNILPAFLTWRKHKKLELVNTLGLKMIAFQCFWLVLTLFVWLFIPLLSFLFYGQTIVGHFPVTLIVYTCSVLINSLFVIQTSFRLSKKQASIYTFLPALN